MILDIYHSSNVVYWYMHLLLSLYYGTATVGLCEDMPYTE